MAFWLVELSQSCRDHTRTALLIDGLLVRCRDILWVHVWTTCEHNSLCDRGCELSVLVTTRFHKLEMDLGMVLEQNKLRYALIGTAVERVSSDHNPLVCR